MAKPLIATLMLVILLFAAGQPPEVQAQTDLHKAAYKGDAAAVMRLLEAEADVHATTKDGETALHLAAGMGHAALITSLPGSRGRRPRRGCGRLDPPALGRRHGSRGHRHATPGGRSRRPRHD